jgi:hypothetical protein
MVGREHSSQGEPIFCIFFGMSGSEIVYVVGMNGSRIMYVSSTNCVLLQACQRTVIGTVIGLFFKLINFIVPDNYSFA